MIRTVGRVDQMDPRTAARWRRTASTKTSPTMTAAIPMSTKDGVLDEPVRGSCPAADGAWTGTTAWGLVGVGG